MIVTPNDGGDGGSFTPASVVLDATTPSATFTYRPASKGNKIIAVTNDSAYRDPAAIALNALAIPQTVAGLEGWWEADSLALANGDPCTLWPDLNGNVRDAVAGIAPQYVSSVLLRDLLRDAMVEADVIRPSQLKGTPYATTGPALYFATGANAYFNIPAIDITAGWTLFFFGYWGANGNVRVMSANSGAPAPEGMDFDGPFWYLSDAGYRFQGSGPAALQNSFMLVTVESDYAKAFHFKCWQNGQPIALGYNGPWAGAMPVFDRIGIRGDGSPCNACYMKAILHYRGSLADVDRIKIERYLGDKHGVPLFPSWVTGLISSHRASAITGVADGASLATWPDSSGHGHDLTQANAGAQPQFFLNKLNGWPSVNFNSAGNGQAAYMVHATPIPIPPAWTIIAIMRRDGQINAATNLATPNPTGGPRLYPGYPPWIIIGNSQLANALAVEKTPYGIYAIDSSPAIYANGLGGPASNLHGIAATPTTTWDCIGSDVPAAQVGDGWIVERLIFDHILTTAERQAFEAYYAYIYGLTLGVRSIIEELPTPKERKL